MTDPEYTEFVNSRFKRLGTPEGDLLHAVIGMVGEAGELLQANSRQNISEELGDLDFYFTQGKLIITELGPRWDYAAVARSCQSLEHAQISLRANTIQMLDLAKKGFIYNKPLVLSQFQWNMLMVNHRIEDFCELLGFDRQSIRRENVEKLKLRFPTGYSDQAAQLRADKPEGQ